MNINMPHLNLEDILNNGINLFLIVIGVMAVGMIIFAAIQIITSGGDVEKAKTGRRALMWGIIGLATALLAGTIAHLVIWSVL